jgi:hypothetical protein
MSKKVAKKSTSKSTPKKSVKTKRNENDIIEIILEDHKPLKELIETLKDTDTELEKRMQAFDEFAQLLVNHAKSEEQTLYVEMKEEDELRTEAFEGDVEHMLADQLLEEAKRTDDEDLWSAKVKVLAELVEHHIEEEESELLPSYRKCFDLEERVSLGEEYLALRAKIAEMGNDDAQSEEVLEDEDADTHARH